MNTLNTFRYLPTILLLFAAVLLHAQPVARPYPPPPAVKPNIVNIQVDFDRDPGFGQESDFVVNPAPGLSNLMLEPGLPNDGPTAVAAGVHRVFLRVQDANGRWSQTYSVTFENLHPIYTPPADTSGLAKIEYFLDRDPGFGKAIDIPIANADPVQMIDSLLVEPRIDTLPTGQHQLFVRAQNRGQAWSLTTGLGFNIETPLPLTWLSVRADRVDDRSQISWSTAQESNTLQFDIEHSTDGHIFSTVGTIPAAGNSSNNNKYEWTHTTPAAGMNYYRIKEIDRDGRSDYSAIVTLDYGKKAETTTVTPNPVLTTLTLLLGEPANGSFLDVYNAAGQSVLKTKIPDNAIQQVVDLSPFSSGVYFLYLKSKTRSEMIRVIKK